MGKDFLHIGKNRSKARCRRTILVCPNAIGGLGGAATPGKVCNIYSHLSLETVFPVLKLTQNCCINIHTFFLKNWQFNHKLGPHLLLQTYRAWKAMLTIWQNTNSSRLQTSQFFSSLVQLEQNSKILKSLCELRKTWKYNSGLYSKNSIFHFFTQSGKIEKSS